MNILVVGGSSGLGLEMAKQFLDQGESVYVTGRSVERIPKGILFLPLDITEDATRLSRDLDSLVKDLPTVDLLVYAAGFFEQGRVAELPDNRIITMVNVGLVAPALLLQRIIRKQEKLDGFIAVTSTSQWIPREQEPVYAATKAGLAMLAQSVSLDDRVQKMLVVGPAGMDTPFWEEVGRKTSDLLSPVWVAGEIVRLWNSVYTYRLARILREPPRVEIIETR